MTHDCEISEPSVLHAASPPRTPRARADLFSPVKRGVGHGHGARGAGSAAWFLLELTVRAVATCYTTWELFTAQRITRRTRAGETGND